MVAIWLAILPKWERLAFISSNIKYYGVFIYSQKKLFYQYYYHFNYQPYKVVKRAPTICQQQLTNCSSIFWPFDEVYLKGYYPLRKVSKYGVISGPNTGKYGPEITPYLTLFMQWEIHQNVLNLKRIYIYIYVSYNLLHL